MYSGLCCRLCVGDEADTDAGSFLMEGVQLAIAVTSVGFGCHRENFVRIRSHSFIVGEMSPCGALFYDSVSLIIDIELLIHHLLRIFLNLKPNSFGLIDVFIWVFQLGTDDQAAEQSRLVILLLPEILKGGIGPFALGFCSDVWIGEVFLMTWGPKLPPMAKSLASHIKFKWKVPVGGI
ncbi:hypothetical protein Tco_0452348 [Tanacetum coccineum]